MKKAILISLVLMIGCRQNEQLKKDWAYQNRYAAENSVLPIADSTDTRVVFMGNSIIEGWTYTNPEFFKKNKFINRGISGQTTSQMLVRFRQDVIDLKPDIVVILAGTNDIAQNTGPITVDKIAGNIISMAQLARTNGIEPVICSVLPTKQYYWRKKIKPIPLIIQLNELLSSYSKANNITYIDFYKALVNKESGLDSKYTKDGIHPNPQGYETMGTLVEKAIREVHVRKSAGDDKL